MRPPAGEAYCSHSGREDSLAAASVPEYEDSTLFCVQLPRGSWQSRLESGIRTKTSTRVPCAGTVFVFRFVLQLTVQLFNILWLQFGVFGIIK